MTELKIIGDALVIKSGIKKEQIKTLGNGFKLKDDKDNEIFAVSYKSDGTGSISDCGVSFNGTTEDGNLQLTVMLPAGMSNDAKKDYVKGHYFKAIAGLNNLEPVAVHEAAETIAAISATFDGLTAE